MYFLTSSSRIREEPRKMQDDTVAGVEGAATAVVGATAATAGAAGTPSPATAVVGATAATARAAGTPVPSDGSGRGDGGDGDGSGDAVPGDPAVPVAAEGGSCAPQE